MKASEFVSWALDQVGCYYWFGTIGQKASLKLFEDRKKAYPSQYKNIKDYESQIKNPKPCFDCAGLVKSKWVYPKYNAADDLGATGIFGKCSIKGLLEMDKLVPGMLVFKGNDKTKTHVGIYAGNGKIIEAKGHAYGVIESDINSTWKYMSEYYNVDYSEDIIQELDPEPDPECNHILYVATQKDELMLRAGPGTEYPIMYRMPKGSKVEWFGERKGDWLKVKYQGVIGYAFKDYLKIA